MMKNEETNIVRLWHEGSEEEWKAALRKYDENRTVHAELEKYMDQTAPNLVRNMSGEEFYEFLHEKYFVWKFTEWLPTQLKHLEKYNNEEGKNQLFEIKENIYKIYNLDPDNTLLLLNTVKSINGLGTAGASGLLAILFPEHYGTLDRFLINSLCKIEDLPEHQKIQEMNPNDIKSEDGIILEEVLRRKSKELNKRFETEEWTPKKIDMILWTCRDR